MIERLVVITLCALLWSHPALAINLYPSWDPTRSQPHDLEFHPPSKPIQRSFRDDFYNEQLMSEFRDRYQERFGPLELTYLSPDLPAIEVIQIKSFELSERDTVVQRNAELQRYGAYVARRLLEFRLDVALRRNPRTENVYRAKEQLTEQKVRVGPIGEIRGRYVISGNFFELRLRQGRLEIWVLKEFRDGFRFDDDNLIYSGRMEVLSGWWIESTYRQAQNLLFLGLRKALTPNLVVTLRFSQQVLSPVNLSPVHEDLLLAGIAYKY